MIICQRLTFLLQYTNKMINYLKQNKQVLVASITLFVLSMSSLMFFLGSDQEFRNHEYKANVVEDNLHNAEKNYQSLVESQKDPFVIINFNGNIKFISKELEAMLGYRENELQGKLFFLHVNPEDFSLFLEALTKVVQTKEPHLMVGPYRVRNNKGDYNIHMGSIMPIMKDGHVEQFLLTTRQIEFPEKEVEDKVPLPEQKKPYLKKLERLMAETK